MMRGPGGELPGSLEGSGADQVGLGAGEVLIGLLHVLIEPGILEDQRRVIGEGLGQGNLVVGEEAPLAIPDGRSRRSASSPTRVASSRPWAFRSTPHPALMKRVSTTKTASRIHTSGLEMAQ